MAIEQSATPSTQLTLARSALGRQDDVCVVVPMFNEAAVITDVVQELRSAFDHVVCVDDGSRDDSAALAVQAGATVVHHPVNLGQGAALRTGIEYALRSDATYFVTFDADGQHRVEDAVRMLERIRRGDLDVVLGSRFLDVADDVRVPATRRLVLRLAVGFTRATTRLALTDTHNGLRVMNRTTAVLLELKQHGMAHASEILDVIARHHLAYEEMPITVAYTDYSRGKGQSSLNAVNILVDLVLARLRVAR